MFRHCEQEKIEMSRSSYECFSGFVTPSSRSGVFTLRRCVRWVRFCFSVRGTVHSVHNSDSVLFDFHSVRNSVDSERDHRGRGDPGAGRQNGHKQQSNLFRRGCRCVHSRSETICNVVYPYRKSMQIVYTEHNGSGISGLRCIEWNDEHIASVRCTARTYTAE